MSSNDSFQVIHDENEGREFEPSPINSLILDYYKRFARERGLEHYFSLTTAQREYKDPHSAFWRNLKAMADCSDSGEKKEDTEVCRISITCVPTEPSTSSSELIQDLTQPDKSDSPPIVVEEVFKDEDVIDVDGSRKSTDVNLDSSFNKVASPTSSVSSHRKLEWDSLADVGYENSRKTSAASLSTLERMAIQQQYSNSDELRSEELLGCPKASSTIIEGKGKSTKNHKPKNPKKYIQKNTDSVEVTVVPSDDLVQRLPINVNLTKHISFNVSPNENIVKNLTHDKEVLVVSDKKESSQESKNLGESNNQNSTTATEGKETSPDTGKQYPKYPVPFIVNIGSVKRFRRRRSKFRKSRVKVRRRVDVNLEETNFEQNNQSRDANEQKSEDQCSEADSFEYMPGHIYNEEGRRNTSNGNMNTENLDTTTDTSKCSEKFLAKDIELSMDKLRKIAQNPNIDKKTKKQLKKQVLMNLVKNIVDTKYKDDDSDNEYLSGITLDSDVIGIGKKGENSQGTSTSNSTEKSTDSSVPKMSILKSLKDPLSFACSSTQSAPDVSYTKKKCNKRSQNNAVSSESDSKLQTSSEEPFEMTSKNLLSKYLDALKREEMYKERLQAKHNLFRKKLSSNLETLTKTKKSLSQPDIKKTDLKDLIDELASKPFVGEAGDTISSLPELSHPLRQNQRHANVSVFTMRAGKKATNNTGKDGHRPQRKTNSSLLHNTDKNIEKIEPEHFCCCPLHLVNKDISQECIQENISSRTDTDDGDSISKQESGNPQIKKLESHLFNIDMAKPTGSGRDLKKSKFICFCATTDKVLSKIPKNLVVLKCRKLCGKKYSQLPINTETDCYQHHAGVKVSPDVGTSASSTTTNTNDESCAREKSQTRSPKHSKVSIRKINKEISLSCNDYSTNEQSRDKAPSYNEKRNIEKGTYKDSSKSKSKPTSPLRSHRKSTITYVSIDPKIPEPTLADVKVLSEDVVKKVESLLSALSHSEKNLNENESLLNVLSLEPGKVNINNQKTSDFQRQSSYYRQENTKRAVTEGFNTDLRLKSSCSSYTYSNSLPSDRQNQPEISGECKRKSSEIGVNTEEAFKKDTSTSPRPTNWQAGKLQNSLSTILENQVSVGLSPIFFSDIEDDSNNNTSVKADSVNSKVLSDKTAEPSKHVSSGIKCIENSTLYSFGKGFAKIGLSSVLTHSKKKEEIYSGKEKAVTNNSDVTKAKPQSPKASTSGTQDTSNMFEKENQTNQKSSDPNRIQYAEPAKDKTFTRQSISSNSNKSSIGKDVSKATGDSEIISTKAAFRDKSPFSCHTYKDDKALRSRSLEKDKFKNDKSENLTWPNRPSKGPNKVQDKIIKAGTLQLNSECTESSGKNQIIHNISKIIGKYSQEGKPHKLNSKNRKRCYIEIIDALKCLLDMDSAVISESNTTDNPNERGRYSPQRKHSVSKSSKRKPSSNAASSSDAASTAFQRVPVRKVYVDNTCQCCEKCPIYKDKEIETSKPSGDTSDSPIYSRGQYNPDFYRCSIKGKSKSKSKKSYLCGHCRPQEGTLYLEENIPSSSSNFEYENSCTCKCNLPYDRKKSVAYNIIIKPSSSVVPEEKKKRPPLENIYVKVPKKFKEPGVSVPIYEIPTAKRKTKGIASEEISTRERDYKDRTYNKKTSKDRHFKEKPYAGSSKERPKISNRTSSQERSPLRSTNERRFKERSPKDRHSKFEGRTKGYHPEERSFKEYKEQDEARKSKRSRSCPEDDPSLLEPNILTLKESLEKNRPDFIANAEGRQHALKVIHEARTREATFQKRLLSMPLDLGADLTRLKFEDLEHLAREIGIKLRERLPAPKFTSEREMKRHSQQIYRRLPEVQLKKEVLRKERIKQTNLLMASLFKKNLQKRTLRGEVNVSNYSAVIKI